MTQQQKKLANGRYEDTNYRYSTKFINRMTGWLIAYIFIGVGAGFGLGALGDVFFAGTNTPQWYTIMAVSLMLSGVGIPLLAGAWFGASALNKYAGPVGLLLVAGIGAIAVGKTVEGQSMWVQIGISSIIVSVALFFYIGLQAKVPIWLQLPMLKSPRVYVTKDKKSEEDPLNIKNILK